jgi:thiol:disulfide interchange protein
MKKQLIHAIAFLAFALHAFSQQQDSAHSIQFFGGTFKEALAKAKAEKKYLFLDAYASWCGPCKTMDKEVYANAEVCNYFNQKFVSIKIDMEKGEGPNLTRRLPSIDGYPSLLFFTPDGHLSKTILGSRNVIVFLAEARLVAEGK